VRFDACAFARDALIHHAQRAAIARAFDDTMMILRRCARLLPLQARLRVTSAFDAASRAYMFTRAERTLMIDVVVDDDSQRSYAADNAMLFAAVCFTPACQLPILIVLRHYDDAALRAR